MADNKNGSPQWVRLYLVHQVENSTMPEYIEGLMVQETAGSYVLNPALDKVINTELEEVSNMPVGMNFISKVHVWRCQILESKPQEVDKETSEVFDNEGGLG